MQELPKLYMIRRTDSGLFWKKSTGRYPVPGTGWVKYGTIYPTLSGAKSAAMRLNTERMRQRSKPFGVRFTYWVRPPMEIVECRLLATKRFRVPGPK
jgi:hypothetical protein